VEKLNFNRRRQKPDSLEPLVSLESHSTKFVENKSFGGYDQESDEWVFSLIFE
jgi:hypothetical protein